MTEKDTLKAIASIAHHGGLIGYGNIYEAMAEIARLSLPYWDHAECTELQRPRYNQLTCQADLTGLMQDLRTSEQAARKSKNLYGKGGRA